MHTSGVIRSMMAKNTSTEQFFNHVAKCIEGQLKEWNPAYEVLLLKLKDYLFIVKDDNQDFQVTIAEHEAHSLQNTSPYSLDKKIWRELEQSGLQTFEGPGNYLSYVYGRYEK